MCSSVVSLFAVHSAFPALRGPSCEVRSGMPEKLLGKICDINPLNTGELMHTF